MADSPTGPNPYPHSWAVPGPDGPSDGVLVRVPYSTGGSYWWFLCPAFATLVVNDDDRWGVSECSEVCPHVEVHQNGERIRQALLSAEALTSSA